MRYVSEIEVSGEVLTIKDREARNGLDSLKEYIETLPAPTDNKLTELVVIGDSFTLGVTTGGILPVEQQLPTLLSKYLGLNLHNYGISEYGYTIAGKLFMMQAQTANNDNSYDHTKVKYVAIIGGINDVNHNPDGDIAGSANALRSYLQGVFPNAKIVQFPCWGGVSFTTFASWKVFSALGYGDDPNTPVYYYPECTTALVGYPQYVCDDNIHPTAVGYDILAKCMLALLNGTYYERRTNSYIIAPNAHDGWNTDNLTIYMDRDSITFAGSISATKDITVNDLDVCDIPAPFTFPTPLSLSIPRADLSGVTSVVCEFTPPLTLTSAYTVGNIRIFTDGGKTITNGTTFPINMTIRRRPF